MSAEERREAVVAAALVEFSERGLAGTSTEDIARRAGISQPYLFRLFPTKKDLFIAVVARAFARIHAAFEQASEGVAGQDALMAMGEAYEALLEDRQLLLSQLHAYAASDDPDIRQAAREGFKDLWELVEQRSGLRGDEVKRFFAMGMLLNVVAALDLPRLDERWARACLPHPRLLSSSAAGDPLLAP